MVKQNFEGTHKRDDGSEYVVGWYVSPTLSAGWYWHHADRTNDSKLRGPYATAKSAAEAGMAGRGSSPPKLSQD